jgi:uncharacterized protein (DUF983 family)
MAPNDHYQMQTNRIRTSGAEPRRSIVNAILRGLLRRCPNCGVGPALEGYLKVRAACPCCGEPLGHIRADDGPAYITVLLVGHIVVPLSLVAEQRWQPPVVPHMIAAALLAALLVWRVLPRVKAAVLGLMWALRLDGAERQGDPDKHG